MVSSVNLEDKKEYGFLAQLVAFTYRRYISAGTMLFTYRELPSAETVQPLFTIYDLSKRTDIQ
jgi:hypothetical protein